MKDREGQLGRIVKCVENDQYDVEWVLGGRCSGCRREDLAWTCAESEGMTYSATTPSRKKRKPVNFMEEVMVKEEAKKLKISKAVPKKTKPLKKCASAPDKAPLAKKKPNLKRSGAAKAATSKSSKKQKTMEKKIVVESTANTAASSSGPDLYERHRREFERCYTRLAEKIDCFRHFWEEVPLQFDENYKDEAVTAAEPVNEATTHSSTAESKGAASTGPLKTPTDKFCCHPKSKKSMEGKNNPYPAHPPYNWAMIRRRMNNGRYTLDRRKKEEKERLELLSSYYAMMGRKKSSRKNKKGNVDTRVLYPNGVDWAIFEKDVCAMLDVALSRQTSDEKQEDDGLRGSLSHSIRKVKEAVQLAVERTGNRHSAEMAFADDRHKFALAVETCNTEAAMQSWRKTPFPERMYERITADVVCAGLSNLDEKIAAFELKTNLPDSFIGQSYRYNDTGQSESWMKSVVDETRSGNISNRKKNVSDQKVVEERLAALALLADEGVTRAQVSATMQSLLIAVQDRVMTDDGVLKQSELRSANWIADGAVLTRPDSEAQDAEGTVVHQSSHHPQPPEIVEQPVWGIDCYTRRNILNCLGLEFDPETALVFVEKWLLPAINACPDDLAHNISNAVRILEGLPFEVASAGDDDQESTFVNEKPSSKSWTQSLLGSALMQKIKASGPPWLKAAANQLRRARTALGPDFFRVHPKGHGSVVLSPSLKANAPVTFYRGELYPSWRWGEKMDAIEITQTRKDLKP